MKVEMNLHKDLNSTGATGIPVLIELITGGGIPDMKTEMKIWKALDRTGIKGILKVTQIIMRGGTLRVAEIGLTGNASRIY